MARHIRPMLAQLVDEPFDRAGWIFEVKWDGYRTIAHVKRGKVELYSRNGISFTERYTPITRALESVRHACILDGEIIALKDGRSDFHTLQEYQELAAPLQYAVFDLLELDGRDLRAEPLLERKRLLRKILPENDHLLYSEHVETQGKKFFALMQKRHQEGMVAKDGRSRYEEGGRTGAWQKVKTHEEQEAIIVGFTAPQGGRRHIGSLVLAAHEGGRLRYVGHSGGGLTERELKELHAKLAKIAVAKPPITDSVPVKTPITWVKPRYMCTIRFTEWTAGGQMRHPIYAGLRADKKPAEVVREKPQPVRTTAGKISGAHPGDSFTHLDKEFWPKEGYTKGDVIAYYDRMADTILPYLKDRPENLNRHPNGIGGKNFYQKNVTMKVPPFVRTKEIWSESNGANLRYLVCDNKETLLFLANLGCIELNPWLSRVERLHHPDYMILDLDPHERPFTDLIRVAQEVKKVLDLACEEHYVKTSGKTGLHIAVPLGGRYRYEDVKRFALLIMRIVNARLPELTSLERMPAKRKGKIYLDYLQNRFGQTIAAPYSIRPVSGARVSTPLEWREVKRGLDPAAFTIKTIWKRLARKGDLWRGVLGTGVDLHDAIRCLEERMLAAHD